MLTRTTARRYLSSYLEQPVTRLFHRLGLSPNVVTLLGLVIAGASAYLVSIGQLAAGGAVMLLAGIFDLFDGALARATGRVTRFGALLDSVIDRISEIIVLLGVLLFYTGRDSTAGVVLVYLALAGSIMVSYLRARAEGLDIECKVGVMTRPERVAALGTGLIVGQWWLPAVAVVLGAVAALTTLTTLQRLFHVWRETEGQG